MDPNSFDEFITCPACSNNVLCLHGDDENVSASPPIQLKPCGHVICDKCAGDIGHVGLGAKIDGLVNCPLFNCKCAVRTTKQRTDLVEVLQLAMSTTEQMKVYMESDDLLDLSESASTPSEESEPCSSDPMSCPAENHEKFVDLALSEPESSDNDETQLVKAGTECESPKKFEESIDFTLSEPESSDESQLVMMAECESPKNFLEHEPGNFNFEAMDLSSQTSTESDSEDSEDILSPTPTSPKKMRKSEGSENFMLSNSPEHNEFANLEEFEDMTGTGSPYKHSELGSLTAEDLENFLAPGEDLTNDPSGDVENLSQALVPFAPRYPEPSSTPEVENPESEKELPVDLSVPHPLYISEGPGRGVRRKLAFSNVDPSQALDLCLSPRFKDKHSEGDPGPYAICKFAKQRQGLAHSFDASRILLGRSGVEDLRKSMALFCDKKSSKLDLQFQDLREPNKEKNLAASELENDLEEEVENPDDAPRRYNSSSSTGSELESSSEFPDSKPKPCEFVFCATRLSQSQILKLEQLCCSTGAKIVPEFRLSVTHLILDLEHGMVPQTMKYFFAIAAKKWILTFSWVEECLRKRALIPEEPFETSALPNCPPGGRISRLTPIRLFEDFDFFMAEGGNLRVDHTHMLELLGGRILKKLPEIPANKDVPCRLLIVGDNIGPPEKMAGFQRLYERGYWITVTWEWIHLCMLDYKIHLFRLSHLITKLSQGELLPVSRLPRPIIKLYQQFSIHTF